MPLLAGKRYKLRVMETKTRPDCIISLTSWRRRINDVGMVIYSFLILEPVCDFRVALVLSSDEFPGKEKDIPGDLVKLQRHPRFEIIWTKRNTKAYKKYSPTAERYPDVPIITVDDDAPAKPNFLRDIWRKHLEDPGRVIYGYNAHPCRRKGIDCVRYGFGMFPPGSLFPLEDDFGISMFGDMDDEFFRLRHVLAGSKYFQINAYSVLHLQAINQDTALGAAIGTDWHRLPEKWDRLFREMPELHRLWKENVGKSNE